MQRTMSYNCQAASQWLDVLPLTECGFSLHKGAFRDALVLHYGWTLRHIPSQSVCRKRFTVEHTFSCPYEGFLLFCHNDIREKAASLLGDNVALEPSFTTLSHSPEKDSREPTLRMVHVWTSKHKGSWVKDHRRHGELQVVFTPHMQQHYNKQLSCLHFVLTFAVVLAFYSNIGVTILAFTIVAQYIQLDSRLCPDVKHAALTPRNMHISQ